MDRSHAEPAASSLPEPFAGRLCHASAILGTRSGYGKALEQLEPCLTLFAAPMCEAPSPIQFQRAGFTGESHGARAMNTSWRDMLLHYHF
jgi:hypothetical protein